MSLPVVYHPVYEEDWRALPPAERAAMATAVAKLRVDSRLGFPHTSLARGGALGVRELRPRRGRSPGVGCTGGWAGRWSCWRSRLRPSVDRRGFEKALAAAEGRLREVEE